MNKYEIMDTCWGLGYTLQEAQKDLISCGITVPDEEILAHWNMLDEKLYEMEITSDLAD